MNNSVYQVVFAVTMLNVLWYKCRNRDDSMLKCVKLLRFKYHDYYLAAIHSYLFTSKPENVGSRIDMQTHAGSSSTRP